MSNKVNSINNSNSQIYNEQINSKKRVNKRAKTGNRIKKQKNSNINKAKSKDKVTIANKDSSSKSSQKNVSKINEFAKLINTRLKFSINEEKDETVIYVIDKESDEIIRSIPPQELSKMAGKLEDIKDTML